MKEVYEKNAEAFSEQRDKSLFEKKWLDIFISHLNMGDELLDVGCGTGDPITKYLINKSFKVIGIDYSPKMIQLAKKKNPDNEWLVQDMQELNFDKKFKGIIAWNSFFHLNHNEQIKTLKRFTDCLNMKGVLMFTAGPDHGDVSGQINGDVVHHWSHSLDVYKKELHKYGFRLESYIHNDPECNGHSVYLFIR